MNLNGNVLWNLGCDDKHHVLHRLPSTDFMWTLSFVRDTVLMLSWSKYGARGLILKGFAVKSDHGTQKPGPRVYFFRAYLSFPPVVCISSYPFKVCSGIKRSTNTNKPQL